MFLKFVFKILVIVMRRNVCVIFVLISLDVFSLNKYSIVIVNNEFELIDVSLIMNLKIMLILIVNFFF